MKTNRLTVVPSQRCAHRDANGRQCRTVAANGPFSLCQRHLAVEKQAQLANVVVPLTKQSQAFQTAQGINHSLTSLYELLASNQISARRASVLAYIASTLLRTLPAIDADNAAGIQDPTKPRVAEVAPVPEPPLAEPVFVIPKPDPASKPS